MRVVLDTNVLVSALLFKGKTKDLLSIRRFRQILIQSPAQFLAANPQLRR